LFAAVAAVHADCAAMRASADALLCAPGAQTADARCMAMLAELFRDRVGQLEAALESSVQVGRVSVPARLALERVLGRVGRDLAGALPLVELIEAASHPVPSERWS
jgi:hypothetical protein